MSDPTTNYPVVEERPLNPAARGLFGRRWDWNQLPNHKPGTVPVFEVENGYVAFQERRHLGRREDPPVNAISVSIVDIRPRTVTVQLAVPTRNAADDIVLQVDFRCLVQEPEIVAAAGLRDVSEPLLQYLRRDPSLTQLGIGYSVEDINVVREELSRRVDAYTRLRAPHIDGMNVGLAAVRIVKSKDMASYERPLRDALRWEQEKAKREDRNAESLRLYMVRAELDVEAAIDRSRRTAEDERKQLIEIFSTIPEEELNALRQRIVDELFGSKAEGNRPEVPARFLMASLPSRAPARAEISLVVRIGSNREAWPGSAAPLRSLLVPSGGVDVTVLVQASPGLAATGPLEQRIHLPPFGESDPVRFEFSGRAAGLQRVRVMAFAGGTFLSEVEVEVSVEVGGPLVDGQSATASLQATAARKGEVTLQVRTDGSGTVFQLLSDRYLFGPVVAHAVAVDAGPAVERAISMLKQLAEGDAPYRGGTARRWMKETGAGLWHGAVPDQIKDQFWQLRDHITTFSIATSQDLIPWELLYPVRRHGADDGFLVEQFPVHRRVFDQPRADRLTVAPCTYIVSQPAPRNAHDEIDAIKETMGDGQVIDDLDTLLDAIDSGACGALHFACHNRHSVDAGAAIAMVGGQFVPGLLNTARLRQVLARTKPLVFLNACRTDSSVPEFRRMVGWAQQFMGAGAGAFVGTLWPTRSSSARAFAEAFYGHLLDGEELGEAALHARLSIAETDPDPTWLAYTVYGDPHARAAQPEDQP